MIPEREPEKWLLRPRMAAGAKITQSRDGEVVTETYEHLIMQNERRVNNCAINNWRASLVPAAAVIPAPVASMCVAAVKKSVVDLKRVI